MIHVPRTTAAPTALTAAKSAGVKELAKVLKHYASDTTKNKPFTGYGAYKLDPVKSALNALFRNKCAYCEIDYGGAPMDVEHFRPKGAVVELDPLTFRQIHASFVTKPGYYWLAATWSNLLPCCIDCNRPRSQLFLGGIDEVSGKSNYFPLVAGTGRALVPETDPEVIEQRLLLHPCVDDPGKHLEFARKGTIRAKSVAAGIDIKGLASIEVYGLQRDPLVRKREATLIGLRNRIRDVKLALRDLSHNAADAAAKRRFRSALQEILTLYLRPDRPFLGMCRQEVRTGLFTGTMSPELLKQLHPSQLAAAAPLQPNPAM